MSTVSPELLDPSAWFAPNSNGLGYVLLDPMTREPVNPNTVPNWVQNDPIRAVGIGFLAARGADVQVTIAYGPHDNAADLGDTKRGWFERQVDNADYYAREGLGVTEASKRQFAEARRRMMPTIIKHQTNIKGYLEVASEFYGGSFQARMERARAISRTPSFVADMPGDSHVEIERAAIEQVERARQNPDEGQMGVLFGAMNYVREWSMIASLGLELHKGELGNGDRELHVFMTMGHGHRDLTRKFGMLGTTVQPKVVRGDRLAGPNNEVLKDVLSTGEITVSNRFRLNRIAEKEMKGLGDGPRQG
jgi:hypothetical protein